MPVIRGRHGLQKVHATTNHTDAITAASLSSQIKTFVFKRQLVPYGLVLCLRLDHVLINIQRLSISVLFDFNATIELIIPEATSTTAAQKVSCCCMDLILHLFASIELQYAPAYLGSMILEHLRSKSFHQIISCFVLSLILLSLSPTQIFYLLSLVSLSIGHSMVSNLQAQVSMFEYIREHLEKRLFGFFYSTLNKKQALSGKVLTHFCN